MTPPPPLRSLGKRAPRRRGRAANVLAGGRWSLVSDLIDPHVQPTERAHARATMLLERYGVVSREAASSEGLPRGLGAVYDVLKAMEDSGRVRRGHFVEGLTGAQFALPGAVDRLREAKPSDHAEPAVLVLGSDDPVNPYGALVDWPQAHGDDAKPQRRSGALVALVDGQPAWWLSVNRRQLITFVSCPKEHLVHACAQLADLPGGRRVLLEKIDGQAARGSHVREALEQVGFVEDYRGLALGAGARR